MAISRQRLTIYLYSAGHLCDSKAFLLAYANVSHVPVAQIDAFDIVLLSL